MISFDLNDLQRQLAETEDYLRADNPEEQQTILRRSVTLRNSSDKLPSSSSTAAVNKSAEWKPPSFENTSTNSQFLRSSLTANLVSSSSSGLRDAPQSNHVTVADEDVHTLPGYDDLPPTLFPTKSVGNRNEDDDYLQGSYLSSSMRSANNVSGSSSSGGSSTSGGGQISPNNRYADPKERESLISKLLNDYNSRKEKRSYLDENSPVKGNDISTAMQSQPSKSTIPAGDSTLRSLGGTDSSLKFNATLVSSTNQNVNASLPAYEDYTPGSTVKQTLSHDSYEAFLASPPPASTSSNTSTPENVDQSSPESERKADTLFFASDLYPLVDKDHDESDLYERLRSSVNDPTLEYQHDFNKTIKFQQPLEQSEEPVYTAGLTSTIKFTKDLEPWEKAMPDHQYKDHEDSHDEEDQNFEDIEEDSLSLPPNASMYEDKYSREFVTTLHPEGVYHSRKQDVYNFADGGTADQANRSRPRVRPSTAPVTTGVAGKRTTSRGRSTSRSMSPNRNIPKPSTQRPSHPLAATSTAGPRPTSAGRASSVERARKTKEELQEEAERQFHESHPFQPKRYTRSYELHHGAVPSSSGAKPDFHDRIEEMQAKHRLKLQEREHLRQDYAKMELLECTFQPKLSKSTRKILENSQPSNVSGQPSVDTSQRLHEEASERIHYRQWLGQELEKMRLAECSFQPALYKQSRVILQDSDQDTRPIYERLVDLQRQRQRHLQTLKHNYEAEQVDLTFQPKIVDKSKILAEQRWKKQSRQPFLGGQQNSQSNKTLSGTEEALNILSRREEEDNVALRLLNEGKRLAKRKQQLLFAHEQSLAESMEAPTLSKGSQKLAKESTFVQADFNHRQLMHQERLNRRFDERKREDEERIQEWFQPTVNDRSKHILATKRPEVLEEDVENRVNRWTYEEKLKIENHRKQIEQEIYKDLSFNPVIDPISKLFGKKSSVQELYENTRGKQRQQKIKQQVDEEINEVCTFHPKINEHSKRLAEAEDSYETLYKHYQDEFMQKGYMENEDPNNLRTTSQASWTKGGRLNLREPEQMMKEIKFKAIEREHKRREEVMSRELEELQECTFQPNIYSHPSPVTLRATSPIVVRGLSRHLELKTMANKLKDEAKQREYEAFHVVNVDKYRKPEDGCTKVEVSFLSK